MEITFTYTQKLPDDVTKEQVEEWAEFEINGGTVERGNPLIDDNISLENLDVSNYVEYTIEEN